MGYVAFVLDDKSRAALLNYYNPTHPDVICDHITIEFGVPEPTPEKWEQLQLLYTKAKLTGIADDNKATAFVVSFNGNDRRTDGNYFHITHSINRSLGATPAYSKQLLTDEPIYNIGLIVWITGTLKFVK
jgi:hypothetical protein